ncbi:unnamed protein product [Triticum turgidum subsp. durum]|uniref:Uncharacterized protein n=1 Tax=Triticum turgidum subsp. durum TaxID=4567 RepID=A0A9R0QVP5_TRITD|nr:unnamed protein product [Triticum turgidum subsp. durum]
MGKYFCEKCNFFDDDISKKQYHCDGCGICRQVPNLRSSFFSSKRLLIFSSRMIKCWIHCSPFSELAAWTISSTAKNAVCYSNVLKDSHHCVERAMHHNCPVCFEYLFDSTMDISVLHCGHTIHLECLNEMRVHHHFACPVCSRSACDMTDAWQKLDQEVAATPMPEFYQKKMVWILCNDCGATSSVRFHVLAQKCPGCSSYNTRETRGGPATAACSRV